MNEIEKRFYDEYLKCCVGELCNLHPSIQIDIYKVDFVYENDFIIEIDGHEYHKTKEQRFNDYTRERYLMRKGYTIIRFMATEVFLNPRKCVDEMRDIFSFFHNRRCDHYETGYKAGSKHDSNSL